MMSSVKAETYDIIFTARVASFYEMTPSGRNKMLKEFTEFLKTKGIENSFLVWRTTIETKEGKKDV